MWSHIHSLWQQCFDGLATLPIEHSLTKWPSFPHIAVPWTLSPALRGPPAFLFLFLLQVVIFS